jgi:hypothetical protein
MPGLRQLGEIIASVPCPRSFTGFSGSWRRYQSDPYSGWPDGFAAQQQTFDIYLTLFRGAPHV